jgi:hypothetical protein
MTAAWAATWAAIGTIAGTSGGWLWRAGRREGKIDQILGQLTALAADHETRIRHLELVRSRR